MIPDSLALFHAIIEMLIPVAVDFIKSLRQRN